MNDANLQNGGENPNAARRTVITGADYNRASGVNPLVWAANPLLDMITQIRGMHQLSNPAKFREQLVTEIGVFEQRAQSVGVPREDLIGARYCLCTALDEVAALMPWGSRGAWARQSLLVSFHNETWGGEKYYQLLARLAQNPERHKDLIELLYYCNALGFEGRFRVENNGYSQLEMLKRRIATILGNSKGGYEARLSPNWQGVSSTPPAWRTIPSWVVAMLCALIALGVYIAFLYSLSDRLSITSRKLQDLEIPKGVNPPPVKEQSPAIVNLCTRLNRLDRNLVTMKTVDNKCIITLNGNNLFASGSVVINASFEPTLDSIANEIKAIQDIPVNVIVEGHTDNDPLSARLALSYKDNVGLSQARADSVKERLDGYLAGSNHRTRAEGYGASIMVDKTPAGKALNRRVELTVKQSMRGQRNRAGVE